MDLKRDLELMYNYQREIFLLDRIKSLLSWDMETYMPKNAIDFRAEQKAYLSSMIHKKQSSDELFETLERLTSYIDSENLSEDDKINIQKFYKDVSKSRKLPPEFVKELSMVKSMAFAAWQEARDKKDFNVFSPHLKKIVELQRKEAEYIGLPGHPYNGLFDDYEEGMTVEKLKPQFDYLKKEIKSLLDDIKKSDTYKNQEFILMKKDFPADKQILLAKHVMEKIGLGSDFSRMDFSEHPFSSHVGAEDVRITTNIREHPLFAFKSTIHESGHALYESFIPKKYLYTILYDSPSCGLHESQSRFWEIMIASNKDFWEHYFGHFDEYYDLNGKKDLWYKEVNMIEPSLIRIESDEIHYPLHVILRFELELGLIDGTINVDDLPELWNEKMKDLIGVVPDSDKDGILQDSHWGLGYFGYFPTYAIGSIYASQLHKALRKDFPDIDKDIQNGDFSRIREWLKEKIFVYGRTRTAEDIIKNVTGEGLNPKVYVDYLRNKYKEIYDL